jgi:hypothetical protein
MKSDESISHGPLVPFDMRPRGRPILVAVIPVEKGGGTGMRRRGLRRRFHVLRVEKGGGGGSGEEACGEHVSEDAAAGWPRSGRRIMRSSSEPPDVGQ